MRVVAIDPAPAKESTMYSAEAGFRSVPASEMRGVLEDLASPVLLCWDAPLTGPRLVEEAGSGDGDFSQRRLDSFFARKETGFKTPKGISVLPYAGCPHWTISRSVLGLPRVGPWDTDFDRLPFHLLPGNAREASGVAVSQLTRSCAVEIHPAVAAWLWCKKELRRRSWKRGKGWKYKGSGRDEALIDEMWEVILGRCDDSLRSTLRKPESDDEFDAAVGYILGAKWLRGDEEVVLLGDRETGAMLLPHLKEPREPDLVENWTAFRARWTEEGGSGVAE